LFYMNSLRTKSFLSFFIVCRIWFKCIWNFGQIYEHKIR
jgi:hypothetical protein